MGGALSCSAVSLLEVSLENMVAVSVVVRSAEVSLGGRTGAGLADQLAGAALSAGSRSASIGAFAGPLLLGVSSPGCAATSPANMSSIR